MTARSLLLHDSIKAGRRCTNQHAHIGSVLQIGPVWCPLSSEIAGLRSFIRQPVAEAQAFRAGPPG